MEISIIILVILILLWLDMPGLASIGVVCLGVVIGYELVRDSSVSGGGWACADVSQLYGNRCAEIPEGYAEKRECELRCLTAAEKAINAANIKKFIIDRGINFPVTTFDWMTGPDFAHFKQHALINMVMYFVNHIRSSAEILLPPLLGNHASYAGSISCYILDRKRAEVLGLTSVQEPSDNDRPYYDMLTTYLGRLGNDDYNNMLTEPIINHGYARYLASIVSADQAADTLIKTTETLTKISRPHASGVEYVGLDRRGTDGHANAIVIDHDTRRIFHFEPHVDTTRRYTPLRLVLDDIISYRTPDGRLPLLQYNVQRLETGEYTPKYSMQGSFKEVEDIYCQTWAMLGGVLYAINSRRPIGDTFAYILALNGAQVFDLLQVFAYHLYRCIMNVTIPAAMQDEIRQQQADLVSIQADINRDIAQLSNDSPRYAVLHNVDELITALLGNAVQGYATTGFGVAVHKINKQILLLVRITLAKSESEPEQGYDQLAYLSVDLTDVFNSNEILFQFKERFRQAKRAASAQGTCVLV